MIKQFIPIMNKQFIKNSCSDSEFNWRSDCHLIPRNNKIKMSKKYKKTKRTCFNFLSTKSASVQKKDLFVHFCKTGHTKGKTQEKHHSSRPISQSPVIWLAYVNYTISNLIYNSKTCHFTFEIKM